MKSALLLVLAIIVTGCAQTRFYENGHLVAAIQADARNITVRTRSGGYFHADNLNHSVPGAAAGKAWGGVAGAVGSAVGAAATAAALF